MKTFLAIERAGLGILAGGLALSSLADGQPTSLPVHGPQRGPFDPRGEIHIPIGIPNTVDTLKTLVEPEGCFSPGIGSCGVYFWVKPGSADTRKLVAPTFEGVAVDYGLTPEGYLIPWSEWETDGILVRNELCEVQSNSPQGEVFVVGSRARVSNRSAAPRQLSLYVALRPMGPAGFPVKELAVSDAGDALLVEGHPAIVARQKPVAAGVMPTDTLGEALQAGQWPTERSVSSASGACSGALRFDLTLVPGASRTFEFVCPVLPGRRAVGHQWDTNSWFKLDQAKPNPTEGGLLQPDPGLDYYRRLSVAKLFDESRSYWAELLGPARLKLPDPRWEQSRAAIMSHLAMVLNEGAPDLVVYSLSVFNRDGAHMTSSLQKSGVFGLANTYIEHFLTYPFQGRVAPEADNPGQLLWVLGEHWKMTRDQAWLARVYPKVAKLAALIRYYRTPPGPHWVYDDTFECGDALPKDRRKELRPGACDGTHPEYTEAFDIAGLRAAVMLAGQTKHPEEAARWQQLADELMANYDAQFSKDLGKGYGSYAVLWPCRLYPLNEGKAHERFKDVGLKRTGEWRYFPLATAHQGLFAGNRLSGHGTLESHLAEAQMKGWYTFDEGGPSGVGGWPHVLTTWSWNYPPEPRPDWAKVSAKAMPDGWALAEFWLLMRDSLLFEDGDQLVLLDGVDPKWFRQAMAVNALPTWFGPVSFTCRPTPTGARLKLSGARPPGGFVLRLPVELGVKVTVGRVPLPAAPTGDVRLPASAKTVELRFAE